MEDHEEREAMDITENTFDSASDICKQLMDRYAKSAAPQHRHLLATAAALRSMLVAESLPLGPSSYFAAAITSIDNASASKSIDSTAVGALLASLAIVLPLIPRQEISAMKASEAVEVLAGMLVRESDGLAASSVKAAMKCTGLLIVEFCDMENWSSLELGFETILKFSVDKRPKVRRCAQDCLEKVFKSFKCSKVTKEASKLVLSLLKSYMPLAVNLSNSRTVDGSNEEILSRPEHLEVLHVLNLMHLIVPHLSLKIRVKVLSELYKLINSHFSAITRHIFKIIEVFFETSNLELILPDMENIIASLASYVSLGEKNPMETVIFAATLLKSALDKLHDGESNSWISYLPIVCESVAGLMTYEVSTASQAASVVKDVINHHIDLTLVNENQPFEDESLESVEASAIRSICTIFENSLSSCDGYPNEHILAVISLLFLKLGGISFIFMKSIVLKLAEMTTLASGDISKMDHLKNCLGSAVTAMGPERILTLLPISLHDNDLSCSNIWLVPILKNNIVGAPLGYYIEHIVPLAKSLERCSRKVKKSVIGRDLQVHAHGLWGLLPAFCHYPNDTHKNFGHLAKLIISFLRKDSFMHENIAVALQVLVNQNKSVLSSKTDTFESNSGVKDSVLEARKTSFSKKTASRNIKALASCSAELLEALIDLFVDSLPAKRSCLKDTIGCLASITDSSTTKNIFTSLLERFQFLDSKNESEEPENQNAELTGKQLGNLSTAEKDVKRCVIMELASSLVEGAKEDLIDLIYNFILQTFQTTNEIGHCEAYYTLRRILEEHAWFCSARYNELIDLLLGLKSLVDIASIRSRFSCLHILMVHTLQMSLEEENTKDFLILNDIILTLKDANEEVRKAAYDILLLISSSLRNMSVVSSDAPYHKLINMIMGYLSGPSPQIKSGAVSALSVLVHNDQNICLSMPDLVPSLLSLLHSKAIEVIKAVLGFVKVLVSSLEAKDLQNILSDVAYGVLPWSSVSRNHFRTKVTVILEIMIRKCGTSAVKSVIPEKYKSFLESVVENRRKKPSSEAEATATGETELEDSSTMRLQKDKHKESSSRHENTGAAGNRKRKWEKKRDDNTHRPNGSNLSSISGGELKWQKRARHSIGKQSLTGKSEGNEMMKRMNFDKGPPSGEKRKVVKRNMSESASHRPITTSKPRRPMKAGRKRHNTK